ncbi:flagellar hook protein FliD [Meridianimarinicoccus roseus]|uniref:Flagellar hook-associated protein 2 n=1 Tax=Meridianimarinicoccus roseus TaxID=2072018 RepID=A0A2V2LBJ3_9RHOB|nr:flagellar filament capping protein FliD [Meridianimarinicoccus roseus]PWR02562.1 flagellar hook protein FliD [Meridianimarinicoccus roseus]
MATDYLSALNKSGSGLNLAQVTNDLVKATIEPRKDIVNERIARSESTISALGMLRSKFEDLSAGLTLAARAPVRKSVSNDSAIGVTVDDAAKLSAREVEVDVFQLAKPQVLEFKGLTSRDAEVAPGTMTIDFGIWSGDPPDSFAANPERAGVNLTVGPGTTLTQLAEQLDQMVGVNARVFDIGDGTFSLGVSSDNGVANALRMTTIEYPAPPAGVISLTVFDNSTTNSTVEVQAATDMMAFVDGIAIFRPENVLEGVIPGATLQVNGTTTAPATIATTDDAEGAAELMEALVTQLNDTLDYLAQATRRGSEGVAAGELAGDPAAQALQRTLGGLISRGYSGFGSQDVYLSSFGVRTERDGTLTFDRDAFDTAFARDPMGMANLLRDKVASDTAGIDAVGAPYKTDTPPGQFAFRQDSVTRTATIGGVQALGFAEADGRITYPVFDGPLAGVTITVDPDVTEATLNFGRSFVSEMRSSLQSGLNGTGPIQRRENQLSEQIGRETDALTALDERMTALEQRYIRQFSAMEQIVTQLNSTGEYLTNLIAAWNKD